MYGYIATVKQRPFLRHSDVHFFMRQIVHKNYYVNRFRKLIQ